MKKNNPETNRTFDRETTLALFQKCWAIAVHSDKNKERFTLSDFNILSEKVIEVTGYRFSDRTYFNFYYQKGSESEGVIEALCAMVLIHDGHLLKKDLQYKEIENKTKGWEKQASDKPPKHIYGALFRKTYLNSEKNKSKNRIFTNPLFFVIGIFTLIIILLLIAEKRKKIGDSITIFEKDNTALKIALLPFRPDDSCHDMGLELQKQVSDSLKSLKKEYNIDVISITDLNCPLTESDARNIGKLKNADMVIWGIYEKGLSGPVASLKYTFVDEAFKKKTDESSNSIAALKSGSFNSYNLKGIINWTFLLSTYYNRDLQKAEEFVKAINQKKILYEFLADNLLFLADLTLNMGEFKHADRFLAECLEIAEIQKNSKVQTLAYAKMSLVKMFLGDAALTEVYQSQAYNSLSNRFNDPNFSSAIKELAYSYMAVQKLSQSTPLFEAALKNDLNNQNIDSLVLATSYFYTGYSHFFGQNIDKAKTLIETAGGIAERSSDSGASSELLGAVYEILSGIASRQKDYKRAYIIQQKSLAHSKKTLQENHPNLGGAYSNLGYTQMNLGLYSEAQKSFDFAYNILKYQKDNYFVNGLGDVYSGMGVLELLKGNLKKSAAMHRKAIDLCANTSNPALDKYYFRAADTYHESKMKDSALWFINKSLAIAEKNRLSNSIQEAKILKKQILKGERR